MPDVGEGENVPTPVGYDDKMASGLDRCSDEGLADETVSETQMWKRWSTGGFTDGPQREARFRCLKRLAADCCKEINIQSPFIRNHNKRASLFK